MDSWTIDILKQCGMSENVINKFKEEEIDKITFLALTESMLKELVPKLKLRAILYSKIVELKEEQCTVHLNDTHMAPNNDGEFVNLISPINTTDMINDITNFEIINERDGTIVDNSLVLSSDDVLIQDIPFCNNRIKLILEQSQEGKNVLKFYQTSNNFSYAVRNKLVRLIIDYEVTHSPDQKLSMNQFLQLSQSIVQIFPNESESTYFIPYLKNKQYVRPTRGKLFDRYCNLKKDIRKLNVCPSTTTGECSSNTPVTAFNQDINDSILWLKNNREPMDIVVDKWTQTFCLRYDQMLKSSKQLNYFLEYPAISGPLGYKLIEIDFNILQPEKQLKLFDSFPILIECLPKYIKNFKPQFDKEASYQRFLNIIPTENRQEITVAILSYLPRIFPCVTICVPKTRIVQDNKRAKTFDSWRPSNREMSEGFICIIKNATELQEVYLNKENKASTFGLTVQPYVTLLCSDPSNEFIVAASYVVINKFVYSVETPLKAVDICFKTFFALNLNYPKESNHIWQFIQQFFYEITTKTDKNYQSVNLIINDLKKFNM